VHLDPHQANAQRKNQVKCSETHRSAFEPDKLPIPVSAPLDAYAPSLSALGRASILALAYVAGWVALWFGASGMNLAVGVSLWYPPAGLTFAVLLAYGGGALPLPIVASLLAGLSIWPLAQWPAFLLANLLCPLGYLMAALLLRRARSQPATCGWPLDEPHRVAAFLAAAGFGGLFSAGIGTLILRQPGLWAPGQSWSETLLGFWVGDFIGVATIAPVALYFIFPLAQRLARRERASPVRNRLAGRTGARLAVVQIAVSAILLALLFLSLPGVWSAQLHPYLLLLMLPVLSWIVTSWDMRGTVLFLLFYELAIVARVALAGEDDLVFQYQLVMAALLASGLMTGAVSQARRVVHARLRDSRDALERRVEQLARLSSQLTLTEQRERHRLAELLHDHLQQLLVAAVWRVEGIESQTEGSARTEAAELRSLLDRAIRASRTLALDLSPPVLRQGTLPEALAWLAQMMRTVHGLRVSLRIESQVSPEAEEVRVLVFESVREALLNVVKHAQVLQAELELTRQDADAITIVIRDRGIGMDASRVGDGHQLAQGFGLFAMRERLGLLGGEMRINAVPGGGTEVRLSLPIARCGAGQRAVPVAGLTRVADSSLAASNDSS